MLENKKDRRRMLLIEGAEICLMFGFIYARLYATLFFFGGGFKVETDIWFKANMHHHFGIPIWVVFLHLELGTWLMFIYAT